MPYTPEQILAFLAPMSAVIVASIAGTLWFRCVTPVLRLLCLLIFFALLTEIISHILWLSKTSNLFLWPIYVSVEFSLLVWIYSISLESALLKRFRVGLLVAFVSIVVSWEFLNSSDLLISNAGRLIESIAIITLALTFFYKTFQELTIRRLEREPMFWVSSGLLLFFSGNLFVFIFANFVLQYSQTLNDRMWAVHAVLNVLLYSAYTYALWISPKK